MKIYYLAMNDTQIKAENTTESGSRSFSLQLVSPHPAPHPALGNQTPVESLTILCNAVHPLKSLFKEWALLFLYGFSHFSIGLAFWLGLANLNCSVSSAFALDNQTLDLSKEQRVLDPKRGQL